MDYGPLVPTFRYNSNTTKPKCSNCAMKTCPTFSQPRKTPSEEESTQSNGNVIQKKKPKITPPKYNYEYNGKTLLHRSVKLGKLEITDLVLY